jgi:hypothetical protein
MGHEMCLQHLRGHLQKVLVWKENPDEFIKELVDQNTRDSLDSTITQKVERQIS